MRWAIIRSEGKVTRFDADRLSMVSIEENKFNPSWSTWTVHARQPEGVVFDGMFDDKAAANDLYHWLVSQTVGDGGAVNGPVSSSFTIKDLVDAS